MAKRKLVALVCNHSVVCNGTRDCLKCPYLRELKVVNLNEGEGEVCSVEGESCGVCG